MLCFAGPTAPTPEVISGGHFTSLNVLGGVVWHGDSLHEHLDVLAGEL